MIGEFSSPKGNTFYHYSDLHQLNPQTRQFTRIQTTGPSPSARSGHRLVFWRHYLLLFGGFHDTSSITKYHNDLWVFDVIEEKWTEIKPVGGKAPEPRSGFTFLPSIDGAVLLGGYAKVKGSAGKLHGVIYNGSFLNSLRLICRYLVFEDVDGPVAGTMGEETKGAVFSIVYSSLQDSLI